MQGIVWLHIATGALAVLAGACALASRKGGQPHRRSGQVFAGAMGLSALTGAVVAALLPGQLITLLAGLLTAYLIATGVLAARRRHPENAWPEAGLAFVGLGLTVAMGVMAVMAAGNDAGTFQGYPVVAYAFLGGIAGIGTAFDLWRLARWRKPYARRTRVSQHLWRMCIAFFIAAGSAFTGPGASAFPAALRESGVLSIPEPLILLLMLFWLFRIRLRSKTAEAGA
ncbi:MAG: hypothetical protein AAF545_08315 [Pseudomonadota bacterium]